MSAFTEPLEKGWLKRVFEEVRKERASWCPNCRAMAKEFRDRQSRLAEEQRNRPDPYDRPA